MGWPAGWTIVPEWRGKKSAPPVVQVDGADGLAGGLDDRAGVEVTGLNGEDIAQTLRGFGHGWQGQQNDTNSVFVKGKRAQSVDDDESWRAGDVAPTLNSFDVGDARTTVAVLTPDVAATMLASPEGGTRTTDLNQTWVDGGEPGGADPLLPLGLDSHRYRCCGNGVIAPVAEWIGERLAAWALGSVA